MIRLTLLAFAAMVLAPSETPTPLFNGKDLTGWDLIASDARSAAGRWTVENGSLVCHGEGGGWLSTPEEFADFELSLEYRLADGANSGVYIRAPRQGRISSAGIEIQIIDEHSPRHTDPKHKDYYELKPTQRTGSIYGVVPPSKTVTRPAGEWNQMTIRCDGRRVRITINGETVVDANLDDHLDQVSEHPGLQRAKGYIGLSSHNDRVEFRNIRVHRL
jgi:hypothetical protein